MNTTVKRIVALGTGAAMLGATVLGAMAAADLSAYPKPFVDNGKFNGLVVVGANAIGTDTLGAADILASLQAANTITETISGTTETVVEGGAKIETSSTKLTYGNNLSSVKGILTSADLPVLLAKSTLTDKDGKNYDVLTQLDVLNSAVTYKKTSDFTEPTLYLDTSANQNYSVEIQFPTAVNLSKAAGETLTLLGTPYVISDKQGEVSGTMLTLYKASLDQTFTAGSAATTVTVGGTDVTVEVIGVRTGGNSDQATIKVNGETKQVTKGDSTTIGGQAVYIKDVMSYDQPVGGGAVRLFIGSQKIVLENGSSVETGVSATTAIDGTNVAFVNSSDSVSKITITYTPNQMDPQQKYITSGSEMTDPVFGAFKYQFVGPSLALKDPLKSAVKVWSSSDDRMSISFTNKDGQEYSTDFAQLDATTAKLKIGDYLINTNGTLYQYDYFLLGTGEYQHIFQLTAVRNTSSAQKITVKDIATGGTSQDWSFVSDTGVGSMVYDGTTYGFTVTGSNVAITGQQTANLYVYTNNDQLINLTQVPTTNLTVGSNLTVTEKTTYTAGTPDAYGNFKVTFGYNAGKSGNSAYITGVGFTNTTGTNWTDWQEISGDDYNKRALTAFGTYVEYYSGDDPKVTFYLPSQQVNYNVYVAPTKATTTTGGANTYQKVVPIAVGAAVLDTEVADYTAQNLIVVGGPCANSVAAALMGNPADCAAGFEQGKAIIKLYENKGNVAILVAGYSGMDTRRAARVLSQPNKYALSGTEMSVVGTSLTDITVSKPQ